MECKHVREQEPTFAIKVVRELGEGGEYYNSYCLLCGDLVSSEKIEWYNWDKHCH